ncbi:MAG: DUF1491 family protein [Pseudomonadota bacterium]
MDGDPPRLKTSVRVSAHLRRARAGGAFATVARHGDDDAGAVIVKTYLGRGPDGAPRAAAHYEAILDDGARGWRVALDGVTGEADVDAWIAREIDRDPDVWVLEIEDADGRAFLL